VHVPVKIIRPVHNSFKLEKIENKKELMKKLKKLKNFG